MSAAFGAVRHGSLEGHLEGAFSPCDEEGPPHGDKGNPFKRTPDTREGWLTAALFMLNDALFVPNGFPIPANIRIACGWPSKGGMASKSRVIGQAWHSRRSADGTFEILISPYVHEPIEVAGVVAHEGIHVAVGFACGHQGAFKRLATTIGLEGRMTATQPGPRFVEAVTPIIDALGPYPHAQLGIESIRPGNPGGSGDPGNPGEPRDPIEPGEPLGPDSTGPKPDKGRMIRAHCPECGIVIRLARKWISDTAPACPNLACCYHNELMVTG